MTTMMGPRKDRSKILCGFLGKSLRSDVRTESADVCAGINSMGRKSSPGRGESPVQGRAVAEAAGEEG